jgi:hypothetical protein
VVGGDDRTQLLGAEVIARQVLRKEGCQVQAIERLARKA